MGHPAWVMPGMGHPAWLVPGMGHPAWLVPGMGHPAWQPCGLRGRMPTEEDRWVRGSRVAGRTAEPRPRQQPTAEWQSTEEVILSKILKAGTKNSTHSEDKILQDKLFVTLLTLWPTY